MSKRAEERREAREQGNGGNITKFYWVLGAVAVIGVAAVGYNLGAGALGTAVSEPIEIEGLDNMESLVELAQGVTRGEQDAPITIVEFADYQCPGCGQFALTVKPQIELNYVQTGKAKFVFYDLPLTSIHAHAFLAARAARCADDQSLFWDYQDVVFRNQNQWSFDTDPIPSFLDYADEAGLDGGTFEACLKSEAHADVVSANMRLAYELGISATPTIMVSQGRGMARRLQSFDYQSIAQVVDDMLAEVEANPGN